MAISIGTLGEIGTLSLDDVDNFEPYHTKHDRPSRPRNFIAWDGEGITYDPSEKQRYVLLGCSVHEDITGMSGFGYRLDYTGISTMTALECIMEVGRKVRGIHVGFSFGYDVEMILTDVPIAFLRRLWKRGAVKWNGYRIEYRPHKYFQISRDGECVRIWDVWGFFQTSFVNAIREHLNLDDETFERIESGKAARSGFGAADVKATIIPYWDTELRLTVEMMTVLRERLIGAGLPITQWHGPGAIANLAMKQHGMHVHLDRQDHTEEFRAARRTAYAGGRFELMKLGYHRGRVYSYDIRSAYPNAISRLPSLANASWRRWHGEAIDREGFGLYKVRFTHGTSLAYKPMPLFYRDERYAVHFPTHVVGWYWSPEAALASEIPGMEILEGYILDDSGERPFSWVRDVYNMRAEWKRDGNPSQIALKLLLNSMYGKTAQRVGHRDEPPKWHQLEWAGWVTSYTRRMIYDAMLSSRGGVIGVETDGIYSTKPIPLDVGPGLGQWESSEYDEMIYLQSGVYFRRNGDSWSSKYRGFDKGSITVDKVIEALSSWHPWDGESGSIMGMSTRFTTMGNYLRFPFGGRLRNRWITEPRILTMGQDGKRTHVPILCRACRQELSPALVLHDLTIAYPMGGNSVQHVIPWENPATNPFREMVDNYQ